LGVLMYRTRGGAQTELSDVESVRRRAGLGGRPILFEEAGLALTWTCGLGASFERLIVERKSVFVFLCIVCVVLLLLSYKARVSEAIMTTAPSSFFHRERAHFPDFPPSTLYRAPPTPCGAPGGP